VIVATPLIEKFLSTHVRIVTVDMHTKFEVCDLNRFGNIGII